MKIIQLPFLILLSALVASCGGGGGGGGGASPAVPAPAPAPAPAPVASKNVLFVGDGLNNVLAAFDILAPAGPGTVAGKILTSDFPLRNGAQFDASRNLLYVGAFKDVAVFANASDLTGKIAPARTFTPILFEEAYLGRMVLDSANDRLYILYATGRAGFSSGFAVFDRVSTMQGEVRPTRVITANMDDYLFAIDIKRGLLYTKLSSTAGPTSEIYVFTNIDKASGEVPLARRIKLNGNVAALGVDTDRDILYAGIQEKGLTALRNASTAGFSTAVISTVVTPLPLHSYTGLLAADPRNDRLYIGFDNSAYTLGQANKLGQSGQEAVLSLGAGTDFKVTAFGFP